MKRPGKTTLGQILRCAAVLSWSQLLRDAKDGLLHLEYRLGAGGWLQSVTVLACRTPGCWTTVCEYWTQSSGSHARGLRFTDGEKSEKLARHLGFIMLHESRFARGFSPCQEQVIIVPAPSTEEVKAALVAMNETVTALPVVALPMVDVDDLPYAAAR
jgi:hypothetical protein